MIKLLKKIWFWIFPVSRRKALKIAAKALMPDPNDFEIHEKIPDNMNVYMKQNQNEPCWYIVLPRGAAGTGMLMNSHLVIISKHTAQIIYNGSANDEG